MPYGVDRKLGGDSNDNDKWMETCVTKVMRTGKDKSTAIAICKTTLKKKKESTKEASIAIDRYIELELNKQ
jgi:ribosomal protein S7